MEQSKKPTFKDLSEEVQYLANKAFSLIELIEVAGVPEQSFSLIRKKILNLGNDILRLEGKYKAGEIDGE